MAHVSAKLIAPFSYAVESDPLAQVVDDSPARAAGEGEIKVNRFEKT